jgi:hypothetical protein
MAHYKMHKEQLPRIFNYIWRLESQVANLQNTIRTYEGTRIHPKPRHPRFNLITERDKKNNNNTTTLQESSNLQPKVPPPYVIIDDDDDDFSPFPQVTAPAPSSPTRVVKIEITSEISLENFDQALAPSREGRLSSGRNAIRIE